MVEMRGIWTVWTWFLESVESFLLIKGNILRDRRLKVDNIEEGSNSDRIGRFSYCPEIG
jgi:hypothetical protein